MKTYILDQIKSLDLTVASVEQSVNVWMNVFEHQVYHKRWMIDNFLEFERKHMLQSLGPYLLLRSDTFPSLLTYGSAAFK